MDAEAGLLLSPPCVNCRPVIHGQRHRQAEGAVPGRVRGPASATTNAAQDEPSKQSLDLPIYLTLASGCHDRIVSWSATSSRGLRCAADAATYS